MSKSKPTLTTWYLIGPILPRKWILYRERFELLFNAIETIADFPSIPEVLQMPKIWTLQGILLRTSLVTLIKKEKEILEVKHGKYNLLESKKKVGLYMGENMLLLHGGCIQSIKTTHRVLVEKLIQLDPNDWSKFQEHKLYNKSLIKRNPLRLSKEKHT